MTGKLALTALLLATAAPALAQDPNAYDRMLARRIDAMTAGCALPQGTKITTRPGDLPAAVQPYFPNLVGPTDGFSDQPESPFGQMGIPESNGETRLVGALARGGRWAVVYDLKAGPLTTGMLAFEVAKDGTARALRGPDLEFFHDRCRAFQQALTQRAPRPLT